MHHLRRDPSCKLGLHLYFYPVLVQRFQYTECGQELDNHIPYGDVSKVFPDTHPSTKPKRSIISGVGSKRAIVIEESLGYE